MRLYYILVICGILVVIGLLMYPTLHRLIGNVEITGFLPLTKAAVILIPYAFLGFIIYAILQVVRR